MHAGTGLIENIDGFVRQETVAHVPVAQQHALLNGLVGVHHVVVVLVLVLDVVQDFNRLLGRGGVHHHHLETTGQSTIFLNVLAVLIQRGGADALNFAPGQRRFEHVGGIERARSPAGTHDGVQLVNEENHVGRLFQLVHHGLHALLKLAAVLGAGHQRSQIQRHHALIEQHAANFLLDDAQGEAFGDGRFAHTGLPDENGVVLFAAAQDLGHALNFLFTAHDGVKLVFLRHFGEVAAEVVEHRGARFFAGLLGGATGTSAAAGRAAPKKFVVIVVVGIGRAALRSSTGVTVVIQRVADGFVVHVEFAENLGRNIVLVP